MPTARTYQQMKASRAAMQLLANGVTIRLGAGPIDGQPCLHYFPDGTGLLVYAWLDGAVWGAPAVKYHIKGGVITGPTSALPTPKS